MPVEELKCPKCGAPVSPDGSVCKYCNAQYVVVGETNTFIFGKYVECNTFKRLQLLIEKLKSENASYVGATEEGGRAQEEMRRLIDSKACKLCQIKNCPFFNQDSYEVLKRLFPNKRLFPTPEEVEKKLRKILEERLKSERQ